MTYLKYILLIVAALMVFGCVGQSPIPMEQPETPEKQCRIIQEIVPVVVEECGEISYTEHECGRRNLTFEIIEIPATHFCALSDETCGGGPLANCSSCRKAMTRCSLKIKNTNGKPGEWTVGANFSIYNAVFAREPITATIDPNETYTFDFQQFYDPGDPISSATCNIFIIKPAILEDCQEVTRTKYECVNVTKMTTVDKEVCN